MILMAHPDIVRIEAARKYVAAKMSDERGAISRVEAETGFARNNLARWARQFRGFIAPDSRFNPSPSPE